MEEVKLSIKNINKSYGRNIIFKDFNIEFYENKVNCILGKSGCGKSTLLNIISGIIKNDGIEINTLKDLGISYIFQDDRLIEWLTVEENIKLVIKKHYNNNEIDKLCDKYLDLVGVYNHKKYYPQMLSGGLRQRVNIARAFIYPSRIIIMDEPFKSIDVKNKKIIMNNFKEILDKEKRTVIFVTHDIEEAMFLGEKIFILGNKPIQVKNIINNGNNLKKEDISMLI
ncbi:ABC transporter ATP-binding protein [Romboutsia sp.]|uniref:ABC transporter ATP-binding protein n=1 Tax=Romboutsia sp. TaxID=1965302 RepID=UPI002BDF2036|nr:ABC transporter ATP-binding protein [Romboutsia sp.]HSQ88294.1 ABC transporter ATP-binding protein [Romboutsia sp.]